MKVALYARVSTQRQAQALTVEQQIERLMGHARQQGLASLPDQVFRDDGYSGASLRRPGLDRLRDRAAAAASIWSRSWSWSPHRTGWRATTCTKSCWGNCRDMAATCSSSTAP